MENITRNQGKNKEEELKTFKVFLVHTITKGNQSLQEDGKDFNKYKKVKKQDFQDLDSSAYPDTFYTMNALFKHSI